VDVNANLVKELREISGSGFMDCKSALVATGGDLQAAADFLRKKGVSSAAKKSSRSTGEGLVESYIHPGGKVGVLIEVNCETDFVARTDTFKTLVRDLAMQIAAACPVSVSPDEVPAELVAKEREILTEQAKASGKPEKIIEKMRRSPEGVRYADLFKVCEEHFGAARQNSTSHAVFKTPWEGDPRVNIQNNNGKAKAYQVRQVLQALDKLEGENHG